MHYLRAYVTHPRILTSDSCLPTSEITFEVEDTGPGIPEEIKGSTFTEAAAASRVIIPSFVPEEKNAVTVNLVMPAKAYALPSVEDLVNEALEQALS